MRPSPSIARSSWTPGGTSERANRPSSPASTVRRAGPETTQTSRRSTWSISHGPGPSAATSSGSTGRSSTRAATGFPPRRTVPRKVVICALPRDETRPFYGPRERCAPTPRGRIPAVRALPTELGMLAEDATPRRMLPGREEARRGPRRDLQQPRHRDERGLRRGALSAGRPRVRGAARRRHRHPVRCARGVRGRRLPRRHRLGHRPHARHIGPDRGPELRRPGRRLPGHLRRRLPRDEALPVVARDRGRPRRGTRSNGPAARARCGCGRVRPDGACSAGRPPRRSSTTRRDRGSRRRSIRRARRGFADSCRAPCGGWRGRSGEGIPYSFSKPFAPMTFRPPSLFSSALAKPSYAFRAR
jgi:hypothetical protein